MGRNYTDNGDGTITDNRTGLMWEKLSDDGSIHDLDNAYTWEAAFSSKIATLNSTSFAEHSDWRLPNEVELFTLINLGVDHPAVDPEFNTGCEPGCTVLTCSCTYSNYHWSSTTYQYSKTAAWALNFADGDTVGPHKLSASRVRAVRGGL